MPTLSHAAGRSAASRLREIGILLIRAALAIAAYAAIIAPMPAAAWEWNTIFARPVSASGTIKAEERAASGFTGVSLAVDASVRIEQGQTEGVTIAADDNILPLVETAVENGTLKIRAARPNTSFPSRNVKITVRAKTIDHLNIAGGGDMYAEALKVETLKAGIAGAGDLRIRLLDAGALVLKIAGSGDFAAAGRAARVHASIAGSGDVDAGKLESKDVEVSIAGSGDALVWARDTLRIKVAGSGDVKYYGDAAVKQSIAGSGSIARLGAAPSGR